MCTLQRLKIWPAVQMQALSVTDTLYNLRCGSDGCLFQLLVLQELEWGALDTHPVFVVSDLLNLEPLCTFTFSYLPRDLPKNEGEIFTLTLACQSGTLRTDELVPWPHQRPAERTSTAMTEDAYLIFNFVGICDGLVGIFVWMQSCHKFIVVDVSVAISVKDICYSAHLQATRWEL